MHASLGLLVAAAGLGLGACRPEPRLLAPNPLAEVKRPPAVPAQAAGSTPPAAIPTAGAAVPASSTEVQVRLPGGALLVLQEDHIVKTVALQAWVLAGAADDPEDRLGLAHLTERLLFHEQAQAPVLRVFQSGGEAASFTTPDHTVFHVLVPSSGWRLGVELLGAVLGARQTALELSESALLRQRQAILTELRQEAAVPQRAALQALLGLAFSVHPYRRPLLGRPETLDKLTRADVAEFFAARYAAARLTLVVTGDFNAAAVTERLAGELGTALVSLHPSATPLPERPREPPQQAPRVAVLPQDSEPGRARVLLGFHVPSARSADVAALEVAAVLLGSGEAARLARERPQRLDSGEEPTAVSYTARDPGLFLSGMAVAPSQVEEAARLLTSEALRLGQREVSGADLQRAQRLLLADAAYLRETPTGRARRLGFFRSLGLAPADYDRHIQALTPLSLRQALGRYLTPENLTLVALRPPAGAAAGPGRSDGAGSESPAGLLRRLQLQVGQSAAAQRPPRPAPVAARVPTASAGVFEYVLPSGARLLIVPEHSVEIVGVAALWPGGLRAEDERTAGAHQLLARLWPRSARLRTAEAVGRELEQISGTLQPVVELDTFGLRAELLSSHLDQGLALLADCLSQPSFSEADADRERRAIITELRGELHGELHGDRRAAASPSLLGTLEAPAPSPDATAAQLLPRDDAATAALRLFKGALLPGHPYALEPSLQSVGGLSRRRLLELFRRTYPLSKLTIAVVGDVDPQTVLERLDARLPAAPPSPPPPAPAALGELPEPRTPLQRVSYLPSQHAHMVVGFRAPGLRGSERYAVEVLFELLAGPLGRLGRELKEKRGLAYAVQGVLQLGTELGYLALHLATSPSTLDVAQIGLREELRKLIDHPIAASELLLAQEQLVSRQAARRQRREGHALELARAAALALPPAEASTEAYEAGVRAVSVAAVQRAAQRYLDDQRAVVTAVLPESLQRRPAGRPSLAELMQEPAVGPPAESRSRGIQLASRQPVGLLHGDKNKQRSARPERRPPATPSKPNKQRPAPDKRRSPSAQR